MGQLHQNGNNPTSGEILALVLVAAVSVAIPFLFIFFAFARLSALWQLLSIVFASGALGGVINALMSDQGFALPGRNAVGGGENAVVVIRPGFFGNVIIGATAAAASWGLYGTFASNAIISRSAQASTKPTAIVSTVPQVMAGADNKTIQQTFDLPLSALVSAFLIGIGGTRWLSSEVDKKVLSAAASKAASSVPSTDAAQQMQASSPSGVLAIANNMQRAK